MNPDRINLLMAVHSHQPYGNFEWVFAEAYEKSYLPFLKILSGHPRLKVSLHYSGCLLDWVSKRHPEFIKLLRDAVERGQVEMLSGGYYEPILSLIPERDILGQIRQMNQKIKGFTGYTPKGAWLTERVWEPALIKPLVEAGIIYTVVDDWHFTYIGKDVDGLSGYYVTEDEGKELFIFPGSEKLRYFMPFKLPHETVNYMRELKDKGVASKAFADDGEKFGVWPGTYKWVYEERWLENFMDALDAEAGWLQTATFSEYIGDHGPTDRIYLTCASYREMMEWSGGYFKNFLVKYPESNNMHKKMLYVSERTARAKSKEAQTCLYKGQCNCAYWHGVFGGLYLNHLRDAVYSSLIEAEKALDRIAHKGSDWIDAEVRDFDCDSYDEILISTPKMNFYLAPQKGGSIFELDFKQLSLNMANTLARRKEPYHQRALEKARARAAAEEGSQGISSIHEIGRDKDADLVVGLNYDWYRRASLLDHFLREDVALKDFASSNFSDAGDFLNGAYQYEIDKTAKPKGLALRLWRDGNYFGASGDIYKIRIEKILSVNAKNASCDIEYRLTNLDTRDFSSRFGVEFNYSLKDPHLNRVGEASSVKNINISDQWHGVRVDFALSDPASLWYFPIETVSDSETGLQRTYQEIALLFHWNFKLTPKETWRVKICQDISVEG